MNIALIYKSKIRHALNSQKKIYTHRDYPKKVFISLIFKLQNGILSFRIAQCFLSKNMFIQHEMEVNSGRQFFGSVI